VRSVLYFGVHSTLVFEFAWGCNRLVSYGFGKFEKWYFGFLVMAKSAMRSGMSYEMDEYASLFRFCHE
jgi:hypothetical protein